MNNPYEAKLRTVYRQWPMRAHFYLRKLIAHKSVRKFGSHSEFVDHQLKQLRKSAEHHINPLAGKNIVFFGDSLTGNSRFPSLIASRLGAKVANVGFGGCRMARHHNPLYNPFSMHNVALSILNSSLKDKGEVYDSELTLETMVQAAGALYDAEYSGFIDGPQPLDFRAKAQRLLGLDWARVDIAVIFYGTNDFSAGVPLGGVSDQNGETFNGALNLTLQSLYRAHPHIKQMYVTPMFRARGGSPDVARTVNGDSLMDFADAIIGRCSDYGTEVYDLLRYGGINMLNHSVYLQPEPDLLHPTRRGEVHIARKVGSALSSRF